MAADHLGRDRLDDIAEGEHASFFGHTGMKDDLQEEVAEFVLQVHQVVAGDRIGNLIGFLDRIRCNGGKVLFDIPRAAGYGACAAPP